MGFFLGYSWTVIGFPFGAGLLVCALCLVDIAMSLGGRAPRRRDDEMAPEPITPASLGWTFALAPFLVAGGFVWGSAAYLLAYLRAHGYGWGLSAVIAAGSIAITWGLFIRLMRVPLPLAPLWWP
jgi:hypothetical protein